MSYYFISQISIHDTQLYQKYLDKVNAVFSGFKGEYLAADDFPAVLEGKWDRTRIVLIKFKNKKDFEEWYNSDEYRKILKYRLAAADCDTILAQGI